MKFFKLWAVVRSTLIFLAAFTACSAQAATMTMSDSDTASKSIISTVTARSTSSETPTKTISVSNQLQTDMLLDQFDASLGTLTGVVITGSVFATRIFGPVFVTCRDSGLLNSDCESQSGSQSRTSSGGVDIPFDGLVLFSSNSSRTINPSEFANFIGTGTISVPWLINYSHTVSANCDPSNFTSIELCEATGTITFNFTASTTVRYTYEEPVVNAVPLPAGMPLLLAGLGGVIALRRRR